MSEEKHHPFGGSSLERKENCNYSYVAEQGYPNTESEASIRGSKLHKACETKNFDGLNDYDKQQCLWAIESVVDICSNYKILEAHKEYRTVIKDGDTPVSFGTADILLITEDLDGEKRIVVIDYKFGGTPVSVYNNVQLQSYGVGGCQEFGAIRCDYYIVQPIHSYCESGSFEDLEVPLNRILSIIEACKAPNPTANPSKDACRFCKARFDCEARNKVQTDLVVHMHNDISQYSPAEVADILDKIDAFEGIMKDMKKQAEQYVADNGGQIDGRYKIIRTKGKSKPISAEDASRILDGGTVLKNATISKTALEKAYVDANYVKKQNTKKSLKEAFKIKLSPLLSYSDGYDKLVKMGGK